jgi:hypothetical protein
MMGGLAETSATLSGRLDALGSIIPFGKEALKPVNFGENDIPNL